MEDDIVFRGEGPCDVFLRRVRKVAFEKGKHKDGDWMAGYASTCFEGEALRWYEGLDEDVQDDWKQLRTALLERFPLVSEHSAQPVIEPPSSYDPMNCIPTAPAAPQAGSLQSQPIARIYGTAPTFAPTSHGTALEGPTPTPAAGPPSAASTANTLGARPNAPLRGRLVVISNSPANRGYVGKSRIGGYYDVTATRELALRVEYTPSETGGPVDFRLLLQTAVFCDPPAKRLLFVADWDAYVSRKKEGRRDKAAVEILPAMAADHLSGKQTTLPSSLFLGVLVTKSLLLCFEELRQLVYAYD
ncbi:hypothetical protein FRC01_001314 [Tulasnella sp. 417]|nr:hypothetical protein FRC01_001314 [Tulasnella sp. 417]